MRIGGITMDLFVKPRKRENIDAHNAYILGSDFTSLVTACYLLRDGSLKGEHIHIIDSVDALHHYEPYLSFVDDRSFYLWDILRSIPSIETEGLTVLDEMTYLNHDAPMKSLNKMHLTDQQISELVHFFFTSDEQLEGKQIKDVFSQDFMESDFYYYWHALFPVNDAYSFKVTLHRYMHILSSQGMISPKYCMYDSVMVPIIEYLDAHHVVFHFNTEVTHIEIEDNEATAFTIKSEGMEETIGLTKQDLLFIHTSQNKDSMVHAVITTQDEKIIHYLRNILQKDPLSGEDITGGVIPINESAWELNWTIPRQPYYKNQKENECVILLHGLHPEKTGDYVEKSMLESKGYEICAEWLYHLGIPQDKINELSLMSASTVPYTHTSTHCEAHTNGLNYAYIGEGVSLPYEYPGSLDYLVHTAMNAVYHLLHITRSIPAYRYSIEDYLSVFSSLYGDETFMESQSFTKRLVLKELLKRIEGSDLEALLKEYKFF